MMDLSKYLFKPSNNSNNPTTMFQQQQQYQQPQQHYNQQQQPQQHYNQQQPQQQHYNQQQPTTPQSPKTLEIYENRPILNFTIPTNDLTTKHAPTYQTPNHNHQHHNHKIADTFHNNNNNHSGNNKHDYNDSVTNSNHKYNNNNNNSNNNNNNEPENGDKKKRLLSLSCSPVVQTECVSQFNDASDVVDLKPVTNRPPGSRSRTPTHDLTSQHTPNYMKPTRTFNDKSKFAQDGFDLQQQQQQQQNSSNNKFVRLGAGRRSLQQHSSSNYAFKSRVNNNNNNNNFNNINNNLSNDNIKPTTPSFFNNSKKQSKIPSFSTSPTINNNNNNNNNNNSNNNNNNKTSGLAITKEAFLSRINSLRKSKSGSKSKTNNNDNHGDVEDFVANGELPTNPKNSTTSTTNSTTTALKASNISDTLRRMTNDIEATDDDVTATIFNNNATNKHGRVSPFSDSGHYVHGFDHRSKLSNTIREGVVSPTSTTFPTPTFQQQHYHNQQQQQQQHYQQQQSLQQQQQQQQYQQQQTKPKRGPSPSLNNDINNYNNNYNNNNNNISYMQQEQQLQQQYSVQQSQQQLQSKYNRSVPNSPLPTRRLFCPSPSPSSNQSETSRSTYNAKFSSNNNTYNEAVDRYNNNNNNNSLNRLAGGVKLKSNQKALSDQMSDCSSDKDFSIGSNESSLENYLSALEFRNKDPREILENLNSSNWQLRREGLVGLQVLIDQSPDCLEEQDLKKMTESFTRMFHDPHSKVFSLFLETLVSVVTTYKRLLPSHWLKICLQRLFSKWGTELLGSVQVKVKKAMDAVRESYEWNEQVDWLMEVIGNQSLIHNAKARDSIITYLKDLLSIVQPHQLQPTEQCTQLINNIVLISEHYKSSETKKNVQQILTSLFDLNPPTFSTIMLNQPRPIQDYMTRIVKNHMASSSSSSPPPSSSSSSSFQYSNDDGLISPSSSSSSSSSSFFKNFNRNDKMSANFMNNNHINDNDLSSYQQQYYQHQQQHQQQHQHQQQQRQYQQHQQQLQQHPTDDSSKSNQLIKTLNINKPSLFNNFNSVEKTYQQQQQQQQQQKLLLEQQQQQKLQQQLAEDQKVVKDFEKCISNFQHVDPANDLELEAALKQLIIWLPSNPDLITNQHLTSLLSVLLSSPGALVQDSSSLLSDCISMLLRTRSTSQSLVVLQSIVDQSDDRNILSALYWFKPQLDATPTDQLTDLLGDLVPSLLKASDNNSKTVRTSSMMLLVELYNIYNEQLWNYLHNINVHKTNLLKIYFKKAQSK